MTFMSNCSCGGKGCGNCGGGDYEYKSPSGDLIESLRSRAEKAEAEAAKWAKATSTILGEFSSVLPLKDVIPATGTVGGLKQYFSNAIKRASTAEATCEKLAKALEDARQKTERSPLLVGFHHGNETMKELLIRLFDVREVLDAALEEWKTKQ